MFHGDALVKDKDAVRRDVVVSGEGLAAEEIVHWFVELQAHWRVLVVEQKEDLGVVFLAHADFDSVWNFNERNDAALCAKPGDKVIIEILVADESEINGFAIAVSVHRHGGAALVEIFSKDSKNLSFFGVDKVAPNLSRVQVAGGKPAFECQMILFTLRDGIELVDFNAEKIGELVGNAVVRNDVVFINEASIASGHEGAAVLNVEFQEVSLAAGKHVKRWSDDDFVFGKVFGGTTEIDRNIAIVECGVEQLDVIAVIEKFGRLHRQLERPGVIVAEKDCDFRDNFRVANRRR